MKNEKLGQEPAFPLDGYLVDKINNLDYSPEGISKRFYTACKIAQGFAAAPYMTGSIEQVIEDAYKWADELLKQEDE